MDARIEFEHEGDQCLGFWEEWRFDATESGRVKNGAFINLRKYGFLTLIRQDGNRKSLEALEGFFASIQDKRV